MRYYGYSWDGAEDLPITAYWKLIEQALNQSMLGTDKFELLSAKEKQDKDLEDLNRLKREGRWKTKDK